MAATKPDNPSRDWTTAQRRDYAIQLINDVLELSDETHPKKGDASAAGKDEKAFLTLLRMRELAEKIAGWALNHQMGLGINGLRRLAPALTEAMLNDPDYQEMHTRVDSHSHEADGFATVISDSFDPIAARRAVINLLAANPGGFDSQLTHMMISALEALEFGEALPILQITDVNRKARWGELHHQLRAVALIEYHHKRGMKKHVALEKVAAAYQMRAATVRGWERSVRAGLGNIEVQRALESAQSAAKFENKANHAAKKLEVDVQNALGPARRYALSRGMEVKDTISRGILGS
jgi:hypothetical protein